MMRGYSSLTLVWLFLATFLIPVPARAADLLVGKWRAETWGLKAMGGYVLVRGTEGLRVEVRDSGSLPGTGEPWSRLWNQEGKGWTIVLGADGQGVWNPWGEAWRKLDPLWAGFLDLVIGPLTRDDPTGDQGGGGAFWTETRVLRWEVQRKEGSFRRDLAHRGLGLGGAGEILEFRRIAGHASRPPRLEITSSRRPGSLHLDLEYRDLVIPDPPVEIYAPLWPLADFLDQPQEKAGTKPAG